MALSRGEDQKQDQDKSRAREKAEDAGDEAAAHARKIQHSRPYRLLVAVGLISFGVVHLLIAFVALQIAWGGGGGEASSQGALQQVAKTPIGPPVLVIIIVGLIPLAGWQLSEALWGYSDFSGGERTRRRLSAAGRAVIYLALAASAVRVLAGAGASSERSDETWTARLLRAPFGQVLVALVGAAVIAVGVGLIVKGIRKKFLDDMGDHVSEPVQRLGQVGHVTKGVALIVIGGLFGWAAITFDPKKAGGLDQALKTVGSSPFGGVLLTLMALGIVCFGLFCFAWARNQKHY